jgi:hypothetical protein
MSIVVLRILQGIVTEKEMKSYYTNPNPVPDPNSNPNYDPGRQEKGIAKCGSLVSVKFEAC